MTFHLDLPYLNYIIDIISDIEKSIKKVSKKKFFQEKDIQDANIRRLDIISNAVEDLSNEIKHKYNESIWREVSDFKERLHNRYFGVDLEILWDLLNNYIPILKAHILKIKEDLNE